MSGISATARKRLEAQGFIGLEDQTLTQINYWLRFSPTICLAWTALGVVLASPVVLWSLVPFTLFGGILRGHPFDTLYNYGLRRFFHSPPLPTYGFPRRFAYLTASVMTSLTAFCFQIEQNLIGYLLGGLMMIMTTIYILTGFCVQSFIYGLTFGTNTRPPTKI